MLVEEGGVQEEAATQEGKGESHIAEGVEGAKAAEERTEKDGSELD